MKSQNITFNQLNYSIKKGFYSFEGYMNTYDSNYSYCDFDELFKIFFKEIKNPHNNTIENRKLISQYYKVIRLLISNLSYDEENLNCLKNKSFAADFRNLKTIFKSPDWRFDFFDNIANSVFIPALQNLSVKDVIGELESEIKPNDLILISFKDSIKQNGFFDLPKVQELSPDKQTQLIKYILNGSKPLAVAMFDFIGYLKYLDNSFKTKEKANIFVNRLFKKDYKDGTEVKKLRSSLLKPTNRHDAQKYTKEVEKYYNSLK